MPLWTHDGEAWRTVNLHKKTNGLAAFLCCGGPSLRVIDPKYLKGPNRIVMGLNNTYPFVVPDIWTGLDSPENYDVRLFWEAFPKIMSGDQGEALINNIKVKTLNNVNFADILYADKASQYFDFSENMMFRYDKNTFAFAIQFLLWMGIKTIYLFGVDLDNTTQHYFDGSYLTEEQRDYNHRLYKEILSSLKKLVKECETRGIRFVSCSSGSKINDFINYESPFDVIKSLEINVPQGRKKKHVLDKAEHS